MASDVFRKLLDRRVAPLGLLTESLENDVVQVSRQLLCQFVRGPESRLRHLIGSGEDFAVDPSGASENAWPDRFELAGETGRVMRSVRVCRIGASTRQ